MKSPRWLNKLRRHRHRYLSDRFVVARRMGARLLLDQANAVDNCLLTTGAWEETRIERLFKLAEARFAGEAPRTFLDIGAHGGFYAIQFALTAKDSDTIIAVEPDPQNRAQLHANLFLNGMTSRVRVCDWAATDVEGVVRLNIAPERNRGISRLDMSGDEANFGRSSAFRGSIEIAGRRIDDALELKGARLIVKIDVEGHEAKAMDGMRRTLSDNLCVLQVEVTGRNLATLIGLFASLGYESLGSISGDYYFSNVAAP